MAEATFDRIIAGLPEFSPPPLVFFGGIGEPLMHPRLPEMIARAKALGSPVELITNGTLLTEPRINPRIPGELSSRTDYQRYPADRAPLAPID
jgi:wyosine [tRNA(Phe)-imidazoG37] synthetase (radical SAM superfamily)